MGCTDREHFMRRLNKLRNKVACNFKFVFILPSASPKNHPLIELWRSILELKSLAQLRKRGFATRITVIKHLYNFV